MRIQILSLRLPPKSYGFVLVALIIAIFAGIVVSSLVRLMQEQDTCAFGWSGAGGHVCDTGGYQYWRCGAPLPVKA